MNMGQDKQMQMAGGNDGNHFRQYVGQNVRNHNGYNAVQNVGNQQGLRVMRLEIMNGLIVVLGIANQNPNGNGNVVAARAEGNAIGNNAKFVRDFQSLTNEADESLAKHKALELEIERLLRGVDTTKGTSVNTPFCKQSIFGKPPSSSESKLYAVTPFPKSKGLPKIDKTHALINPFKPYREEKYVPNKVRASVRTNPITVSQPYVITKKEVNSDSNGLSSKGVDNTSKTKRPQPRSNTKNDRVPFASKSSCNKNKEIEVEEHPKNLLFSKNKKHISFEYNNIKLAI
nr:hypothetical protein [Tanacetum cinerariifolium]